jgi:hypothetical protein
MLISDVPTPPAVVRVETHASLPSITALSWDTEGGDRAKMNLLRKDSTVTISIQAAGEWKRAADLPTRVERLGESGTRYRVTVAPDAELAWEIAPSGDQLTMRLSVTGAGAKAIQGLEMLFPFDPRAAATTVFPAEWRDDGSLSLPAVISAPDFGQMLLTASPPGVNGRLVGSRADHWLDFTLDLPVPEPGKTTMLTFKPTRLPDPPGLTDKQMWRMGRRGWFNIFEPAAQWGDQGNPFSAPAGVLANNVLSDPVSCLLSMFGDQALLTPSFSKEIRIPDLVRRTVDWWLTKRTKPSGEVYAYWAYADMLDANAGPIIAAWDYVEASRDHKWLTSRIDLLELVADYLIKRDIDDDGLIESTHSGNYGTLKDPQRADSAYDTINSGHKNAYSNALAYRAFRCMADLEKQLRRPRQSEKYARRADSLKAKYVSTFLNPKTGWLVWWKSEDGEMHDLAAPMISSLAICYGLVSPEQGRPMMNKLWAKMERAGFKRLDLGVPLTLVPVRRGDYLAGVMGTPTKEDGSDTFGHYLNGGCMVSDAVYFITAMHIVGEPAKGDKVLDAMLQRQEKGVFPNGGGFQNGVINKYPEGAEFYTWDGETTGYEGHLTYSFTFVQAILLREPAFRARLFRPMLARIMREAHNPGHGEHYSRSSRIMRASELYQTLGLLKEHMDDISDRTGLDAYRAADDGHPCRAWRRLLSYPSLG